MARFEVDTLNMTLSPLMVDVRLSVPAISFLVTVFTPAGVDILMAYTLSTSTYVTTTNHSLMLLNGTVTEPLARYDNLKIVLLNTEY